MQWFTWEGVMQRPRVHSGSGSSYGGVSDDSGDQPCPEPPMFYRPPAPEPDAEPITGDPRFEHLYLWYWEYRKEYITWRWYRWGRERIRGEWGVWWEVWRSTGGGPFVKNRGRADGEGRSERRDEWRWRPLTWSWPKDWSTDKQ